ncbi:MAG: hypothetical protein ACOCXZ_00570 [Chloroflexota bacterium]
MKRPLLSLLILAALLLLAYPASAESDDYSDDLLEQLKILEATTSYMRGLEIRDTVSRFFLSRADAVALFAPDMPENYAPNTTRNQFYRALDLLDDDADLGSLIAALNGGSVGGYYDLLQNEINLVLDEGDHPGDALTPIEQIIYVHEFTHALQDQHFRVRQMMQNYGGTVDGYSAVLSLIEGDAMYMQELFVMQAVEADPANAPLLDVSLMRENTPPGVSLPEILRAELYLSYLNGMSFVKALYASGGWDAVNAAYDDPPRSTEHILHPDRYLAGDAPLPIYLNDVNSALLLDGWTRLFRDRLGEFYLRQYLGTQLDALTVDVASTGWGGDDFALYYNETHDLRAWVLKLAWDTPADQEEFGAAYRRFARLRTGSPGRMVDGLTCWEQAELALCLVDTGVFTAIASAPTVEEAAAMIALQQ